MPICDYSSTAIAATNLTELMAHLIVRIVEMATASTEGPIVAKKKQAQSQADATATAVDMNNQHFASLQEGCHSFVNTL